MQMARLVNQKIVNNQGFPLEGKFQLEVEFHKSQHEDDQNGQPRTSIEVYQQEGEAQIVQGQEGSSTEEEESYILVRDRKRRVVKPPKRYAQADVIGV